MNSVDPLGPNPGDAVVSMNSTQKKKCGGGGRRRGRENGRGKVYGEFDDEPCRRGGRGVEGVERTRIRRGEGIWWGI